jgi:hypothetical protein
VAAAESAIDLLSRIASHAVEAPTQRNKRPPLKRPGANGPKRVPGGPRLKPCSCGQGKPHKNSNYKGCAKYKGRGQVKGTPGGAPGGGSSSSSSSSVSSSATVQPSCRGKNCSATIRLKQGMYCKDCKGTTNFICSHWLCVANGKEVGHDTGVRYGDPCPNHCVTCATATCRRKIVASAATRGTHSHKLCDACRPQRVRRRGRRKTHGKRKNESLSDSRYGSPIARLRSTHVRTHTTHPRGFPGCDFGKPSPVPAPFFSSSSFLVTAAI